MTATLAAILLGCAAWLVSPARSRPRSHRTPTSRDHGPASLARHRLVISLCAALGGLTFLGAPLGWFVGAGLGVGAWVTLGSVEPPAQRRAREAAERELPQVVQLMGLVLDAGGSLAEAVRHVVRALPGPGTDPLHRADARLGVGMTPVDVWRDLADHPGFERVGRAFARAEAAGMPVADIVRRLAEDLAREQRARAEDRARTVGVRAALPLGLCLLPAFLVVGIVPVVASAMASFRW